MRLDLSPVPDSTSSLGSAATKPDTMELRVKLAFFWDYLVAGFGGRRSFDCEIALKSHGAQYI